MLRYMKAYSAHSLVVLVALALYIAVQCQLGKSIRPTQDHPIVTLMRRAEESFLGLLSRQTTTLEAAKAAYRLRRHGEPPEGFDQWFTLALRSKAVIVEDFWDPIYQDLDSYTGTPALLLRSASDAVSNSPSLLISGFSVRAGNVSSTCQPDNKPCRQLEDMIRSVAEWLPDMNIPVNDNASPRVIVPSAERHGGHLDSSQSDLVHRALTSIDHKDMFTVPDADTAFWLKACSPDSPARQLHKNNGQSQPESPDPSLTMSFVSEIHSWQNVCQQPWLRKMHGALVRPLCLNVSQNLLPIFSSARIAGIETAILYPDAIFWAQDPDYYITSIIRNSTPWNYKSDRAFWRGSNTGGGHGPKDWQYFHRHRFVALTNASYLSNVESGQQQDWAGVEGPVTKQMMQLAADHLDTGFSALACRDDLFRTSNRPCSYLDAHFHPVPWVSLPTALSSYRYLFDIDGNSFSGRFHALLLSESVVLKATIFREWHDARLIPWLHFVPLANRFGTDLWHVLAFFLANEDEASYIARSARSWALRVLRREDMELYLLRLLLEWARLIGS
ncbi:glycosyltransferase family 90 protein [Dothistroma septosporum NZE10]|uniref:Glycosyltransferase family 90 protein n=1 Tax=Dothistroma septosporum (strain NZE10 / CBS 128990) TaxID=675120 RepID=N1PXT3_DOTSN|nr:glycosyltransferase family 90 protein [Dothistroma septosporum NZE10]